MRLVNYWITNYKSIRSIVKIGPLNSLNCLIGPNNEGKSTALEPLHLLRSLADNLQTPYADFTELLPDKVGSHTLVFELEFEYTASDVTGSQLDTDQSAHGHINYTVGWGGQIPGAAPEHFHITNCEVGAFGVPSVNAVTTIEGPQPIRVAQSGLSNLIAEGPPGNSENLVAAGLTSKLGISTGGINERYGVPKFLANWARRLIYVESHRTVTHTERYRPNPKIELTSLPSYLHLMRNTKEQKYSEYERVVNKLIPAIKRVYTHMPGDEVSIRVSSSDVEDTSNAFGLDYVGAGVKEILYLAAVIWLSDDGSIILIEEPERGLHARSQRYLVDAALGHACEHNKQLFWTTHSTVMAQMHPHVSVFLVTMSCDNESTVTHLDEGKMTPVLSALGQMNVDIYNYDLLVVFDGESENAALPMIFNQILGSQAFRAIQFHSLGGDLCSKKESVEALLDVLPINSTKIFLCVDDDEGVQVTADDLVRAYEKDGRLTIDRIHIWDCGFKNAVDSPRQAEFEDNFSLPELVEAANLLAEDAKLDAGELQNKADKESNKQISKVLERYFYETYGYGLSKPRLGRNLGMIAKKKIVDRKPRGKFNSEYEFELAIGKARELLPDRIAPVKG